MGKRSNFLRIERDDYPTPASAVQPLLAWLERPTRFIEPCIGRGALADHLVHAGHVCVGRHDLPVDARSARYSVADGTVIITNPPGWGRRDFLAELIVNFADQMPAWLLLSADFAHNVSSGQLLRLRCRMIISVGRVKWFPDSEHAGFDNVAWYLFGTVNEIGVTRFVGRVAA